MAIINISHVSKQYGKIHALKDVSLQVEKGTVFGFLGPNGAGKTTLIRVLTGLITPSSGNCFIDSEPITTSNKQKIGYLAQQPTYYPWMTARELLYLSGRLYGMEKQNLNKNITRMLEICGITDAAERRIGGFSGGMKQRLGIAQAILHNPQVVFLDEPVSALDPQGRKDVLQLIKSLSEQTTIFMSSHILDDVQRVCDEVAIIRDGTIRIHEKTKTLLQTHAQSVVECEFNQNQDAVGFKNELQLHNIHASVSHSKVIMNNSTYELHQKQIFSILAKSQWELLRLEHQEATLEDVFMLHMQGGKS